MTAAAETLDGADLHHLEPTPADLLTQALLNADHRGHRLPCRVKPPERWWWTSEDRDERAAAAQRCEPCPVLAECGAFARAYRERWGVWGAVDRSPRKKGATPPTTPQEATT